MRKIREAVCRVTDLVEGIGKVVPLGNYCRECALFIVDGDIFATGSLCPHQNTSLEDSRIECGKIVCRRHRYIFDPKTGDCLTAGGYGLPVYSVDIEDGAVYVSYWDFEE